MRHRAYLLLVALSLGASLTLDVFGQTPQIDPNGIKNAASLVDAQKLGIAPGSLVSIFGGDLALNTASAQAAPYPLELGGTQVTFNGVPMPLLYVSPAQINAQAPFVSLNFGLREAEIVVYTPRGSSVPITVPLTYGAVGLFTSDGSGRGHGLVLNVHRDGSVSPNSTANSFDPGEDRAMIVYSTGDSGRSNVYAGKQGATINRVVLETLSSTVSGDWPGMNQSTVRPVLRPLPEGCAIPLYMNVSGYAPSQQVAISVRIGGGACVDPAPTSLAEIRWEHKVISSLTGISESDSLVLQFTKAPNNDFDALPTPCGPGLLHYGSGLCSGPWEVLPRTDPQFQSRVLDAGLISVRAPGMDPIVILPESQNGEPTLRLELPSGSIRGGEYRVTGTGGADVGPFDTTVTLPAPIQFTDDFTPGKKIDGPVLVTNWIGGDQRSWLVGNLIFHSSLLGFASNLGFESSAAAGRASTGQFLGGTGCVAPCPGPFPSSDNVQLQVVQIPARTEIQTFSAPGLTLGGRHTWRYEFNYYLRSR